jgi:hypothetical protein
MRRNLDTPWGQRMEWPPGAFRWFLILSTLGFALALGDSEVWVVAVYARWVGIVKRMLVPRPVRKAMHPVRTTRRAITPRPIKKLTRGAFVVAHPFEAIEGGLENMVVDALRPRRPKVGTAARSATSSRSYEARLRVYEDSATENAVFGHVLSLFREPLAKATAPTVPPPVPVDRLRLRRRLERDALHGIWVWKRSERRAARQAASAEALRQADAEDVRRAAEARNEQARLDGEWANLLAGHESAMGRALDAAMGGASVCLVASATGKNAVFLAVGVPDVDLVPETEPTETPTGLPSIERRSITTRNHLYAVALASLAVAYARRALAAVPSANQAGVLLVRSSTSDGWEGVASGVFGRDVVVAVESSEASPLELFSSLGGEIRTEGRTHEVGPLSDFGWARSLLGVQVVELALARRLREGSASVADVVAAQADDELANSEPAALVELPARVTQAWIERTLPNLTRAEALEVVHALRQKGWGEDELVSRVLPHLPAT